MFHDRHHAHLDKFHVLFLEALPVAELALAVVAMARPQFSFFDLSLNIMSMRDCVSFQSARLPFPMS